MALTLDQMKASNGSGEAVRGLVTVLRSPGATVITPNSLVNYPTDYVITTGPLLADGTLNPAKVLVARAHTVGSTIVIDELAPGYTDQGSAVGDVVVIKPTTWWADVLQATLLVAHNPNGTIKNDAISVADQFADPVDPVLRLKESTFDFIASGLVLTGTSYGGTLGWALTSGVVYINGRRLTVAAASGVVIASKDTYFDVLDPGTGTVGTLVYTGGNSVANNAASPALATDSIRVGIIQSGANIANIAAINQGQRNKILPIASSIPYTVTDSLGNLINPRDPTRRVLGYRRLTATVTTTSVTPVQALGLTCPVIVPNGASVMVNAFISRAQVNAIGYFVASIWDGAVNVGTQLTDAPYYNASSGSGGGLLISGGDTPTAGPKTYNVGFFTSTATGSLTASPVLPAYIEVIRE